MTMQLTSVRAFRDELALIARDGEQRQRVAERYGEEYLPGGELPSNDTKLALAMPTLPKTKEEWQETYRTARKPASAALSGAFGGVLLSNVLSGGGAKGWGYRAPALVGAGTGVADYLARGRLEKDFGLQPPATAKIAMLGSRTFTSARELARAGRVGTFHDKLLHKGSIPQPPTLGRHFQLPTAP